MRELFSQRFSRETVRLHVLFVVSVEPGFVIHRVDGEMEKDAEIAKKKRMESLRQTDFIRAHARRHKHTRVLCAHRHTFAYAYAHTCIVTQSMYTQIQLHVCQQTDI